MNQVLTSSREGDRLVLTIVRPERRNALNAEVIAALRQALEGARGDASLRALVLTGAGEEAFCAGADLAGDSFAFDHAIPTVAYADLLRSAHALHVPLVARVNGAAMRSMAFEEAIAFAEGQIGLLAMTQDAREGLAAFKEKRRPQWAGR